MSNFNLHPFLVHIDHMSLSIHWNKKNVNINISFNQIKKREMNFIIYAIKSSSDVFFS